MGSPRTAPRAVQGAMVTNGFRRIRLALPEPDAVSTPRRPPSATNQTGVATGVPSRLYDVRLRYLPPITAPATGGPAATARGVSCTTVVISASLRLDLT